MIKISIIIPVYNSSKYLSKCLDSVINQTYSNLEIICINDGSTDKSLTILKKYRKKDERIKIVNQKNCGVSIARNKALEMAVGEYIMFVDSDDFIDNDMIEKLYNLTDNKRIDIVRCGYIKEYKDKSTKHSIVSIKGEIIDDKGKIYEMFINNYYLNSPCCQLIRKRCIKNYFNEDIKIGEDYLFNLDLYTNACKFIFIPECYYHYNYNDNSATTTISVDKIIKSCDDAIFVYSYLYSYLKLWNIDSKKNRKLISYRIIKEFNIKLIKIFLIDIYPKKKMEIIKKYLYDDKLKKILKKLKFGDIFKLKNPYFLFILFIYLKNTKLYYLFGNYVYKNIYKANSSRSMR